MRRIFFFLFLTCCIATHAQVKLSQVAESAPIDFVKQNKAAFENNLPYASAISTVVEKAGNFLPTYGNETIDEACSQSFDGVPDVGTGFSDGYMTANDVVVAGNSSFTLQTITFEIACISGEPTEFDLEIFEDNGTGGVGVSTGQTVHFDGSNMTFVPNGFLFGVYPQFTVTFTVPDIELTADTSDDARYWLAIASELSSFGTFTYWVGYPYTSNPDSFPAWQNDGITWYEYGAGVPKECVMEVAGNCEEAGATSDNCSDVTPTTLTNGVSVTFTGDTSEGTASTEEMNVLGYGAVWEAVTLTGSCNNLTIDYCGTPSGHMSNMFIVYTPDCPATSYVIGSYDFTTCGDGNGTLRYTGLPAGTYYLPVIIDGSFNVLGEYTMNVISEECPPPPANDDCANAIAIACGDSVSGSTQAATNSGGNAAGDVFYTYTGSGSEEYVTVSLCGSSYDTYLRVYTDCTLSTEIISNDDFCGLQSELTFTSDGTSTYVIMVEGYSSNVGAYTLALNCEELPEPPATCADHEVLDNGMENAYFFANRLAVDIPVADEGFTVEGVNITIAVPIGSQATFFDFIFFDNNGGIPGTQIDTATGTIINSEIIGQNFGRDFIQYEVDFDAGMALNANTTYWMEVQSDAEAWDWTSSMASIIGETGVLDNGTGWASADGGEFVYDLICDVVDDGTSDNCSDVTPTTLTNGVSVTFTGDTSEGTASTEEMNVLGYGAVWEAVTLTGDCNNLTIDYCGTPVGNMSNMFIVYTPDCPATSYVVGSYDFTTCGDGNGTLRFIGLPAGTYYLPVIIDGSFNVLGEYTMNVISEDCPPPPANDDCEDAIAVACGDNLSGSTFGAMDSGGNPAGDVFYSFTGTGTSELVTVSLCGSSYDTYLRVFTDCTLSTEIAFNDDFCGLQSELTFTSDGTSTYIIMVEGYAANVGDFVMNIDCDVPPPPPAECEDHEVLDNGMENAYFFANRLAVDIPVGDTGFTVEGLYITIAVPEGTEASSFNFIFFDDNSGIPGSEVGSATGSIIGSEVIGQNFGRDFIQYNVDFDAGVSLNANTNYWMEVQSDAEAWDWTSEMTSIIGQTGVLDNGTGWATADGGEFVYALYCEEMGVSDMNDFEFAYYPNPVKDYLNIESQKAIESIDAFNLVGQKVISNAVLSEGKINLNHLSTGTYVFRVKLEGGQIETFKIVKK